MNLLLLRHGKAEDLHPQGDFARQLVEKGRRQAAKAARLAARAGILPDIVLTSPLVRARQTAEVFCETAGMPGPVIQDWLACGMGPDTALRELAGFRDFKSVAIVGHEPDFSQLIAWILKAPGGGVEVKKGSFCRLSIDPPSRRGVLNFLIPPKLAGHTGRDDD